MRILLGATVMLLAFSTIAYTQEQGTVNPPSASPKPTIAEFAYGTDSDRQKLDFWKAASDVPTPLVMLIHGGAWKVGDKSEFRDEIKKYLDAGISVAAIHYRFIDEAMKQKIEPPVKASIHDAARALQTIRFKAKEWGVDPHRIGAAGVSAGACTSLWLAFHDDLADLSSSDPIAHESTRLICAAGNAPQTSLDPKELREWMPNAIYGGHAFGFAAPNRSRAEEFELLIPKREQVLPWIKEYSPIEHVSKGDPPVYLSYPTQKIPVVIGEVQPDPTHSAVYGVQLAERLKPLDVECVVTYPAQDKQEEKYGSIAKFVIEKLKAN